MPEIVHSFMVLMQLCAGAFLAGLFFQAGAVAGVKLGTRLFGPIQIGGTVPVSIIEKKP